LSLRPSAFDRLVRGVDHLPRRRGAGVIGSTVNSPFATGVASDAGGDQPGRRGIGLRIALWWSVVAMGHRVRHLVRAAAWEKSPEKSIVRRPRPSDAEEAKANRRRRPGA